MPSPLSLFPYSTEMLRLHRLLESGGGKLFSIPESYKIENRILPAQLTYSVLVTEMYPRGGWKFVGGWVVYCLISSSLTTGYSILSTDRRSSTCTTHLEYVLCPLLCRDELLLLPSPTVPSILSVQHMVQQNTNLPCQLGTCIAVKSDTAPKVLQRVTHSCTASHPLLFTFWAHQTVESVW